ncbi:hypothetical protein [Nocardia sp. NPDC050406]|uniref:hypothetical protein n=1 Tax=Nocardia sp. NPDC050406 TaxID=3364318 RepID=UPI0037AE6243
MSTRRFRPYEPRDSLSDEQRAPRRTLTDDQASAQRLTHLQLSGRAASHLADSRK